MKDYIRPMLRCGEGGRSDDAAFDHTPHHGLSTFGRQGSILVGVHSVLLESLTFGNISVHGRAEWTTQ